MLFFIPIQIQVFLDVISQFRSSLKAEKYLIFVANDKSNKVKLVNNQQVQ